VLDGQGQGALEGHRREVGAVDTHHEPASFTLEHAGGLEDVASRRREGISWRVHDEHLVCARVGEEEGGSFQEQRKTAVPIAQRAQHAFVAGAGADGDVGPQGEATEQHGQRLVDDRARVREVHGGCPGW